MVVFIKENSLLARLAARRLDVPDVAVVVGRTIYLWGASREEFLQDVNWVRHEVTHIYQYRKLGVLRFLCLYLAESARKGYFANHFEKEAREGEKNEKILNDLVFR